jgi:hypothetical protein
MCWTLRCLPFANLDRAFFALRILAEIERRPVHNTAIPRRSISVRVVQANPPTANAVQNPVQYAAASDHDEPCDVQPTVSTQPETAPYVSTLNRRYPRQDSNL